jgi:hypothetical protein
VDVVVDDVVDVVLVLLDIIVDVPLGVVMVIVVLGILVVMLAVDTVLVDFTATVVMMDEVLIMASVVATVVSPRIVEFIVGLTSVMLLLAATVVVVVAAHMPLHQTSPCSALGLPITIIEPSPSASDMKPARGGHGAAGKTSLHDSNWPALRHTSLHKEPMQSGLKPPSTSTPPSGRANAE